MEVVKGDNTPTPSIWAEYDKLLNKYEPEHHDIEMTERFAFYERAKKLILLSLPAKLQFMQMFCSKRSSKSMSRVLAFDFGASTGRAILAEYENGRLSYNEVHRFDNSLVEKDGLLCWDFEYLLGEVKKRLICAKMLIPWLLTPGVLITECLTVTEN